MGPRRMPVRPAKERALKGVPPRARRGRLHRLAAVLAIVVALAAALAGTLLFSNLSSGGPPPGPKTAAIVDQLSLTQPNPEFAHTATDLLEQAGYTVDHYQGEQVTVDFYRVLPRLGYDLILLRAHSGLTTEINWESLEVTPREYVGLFTNEPYVETKYPEEQRNLLEGVYYSGAPSLFGIGPDFITADMVGEFDDTIIVMMGCDGLRSQDTAQAFLDKGASAFVSWTQPVSAAHTDAATERLLEKFLIEGLTVEGAVTQTAAEIGPDPMFEAELRVLADGG